MRRLYSIIVCIIVCQSLYAQSGNLEDFVSIREAMSVVAYRRYHPAVTYEEMSEVIATIAKRYGYREEDFLDGVGTCSIWQYIRGGHVTKVINGEDYFIPDNKTRACTFSIFDCDGIETIEYDETSISVEMRLYNDLQYKKLMQQLVDIGFKYKKYDKNCSQRIYEYQSYEVGIYEGTSRGHKYWEFSVRLNLREYGTTKNYTFADSSMIHNFKIKVDYPVKGDPVFLRRVRTFIMEALEPDILDNSPIGRYSGNTDDPYALINYYGKKRASSLKDNYVSGESANEETIYICKVGENDHYISLQVDRGLTWTSRPYGLHYGATFRKSDGKRLHVIANPDNSQFKELLSNDIYFESRDYFSDEYKNNLPMPKYEPFLIQSGVRFIYQKYEIGLGAAGVVKGDSPYASIWPYLSDEVKEVLNVNDNPNIKMLSVQTSNTGNSVKSNHVSEPTKVYDLVDEMPQFPGGPHAMFEYLSKNIKYPVVAEENGVQGRVIVTFIVESDGSVTNTKVVKSVDPSLDKEALRVVKSMPHWIPGRQNGSAVRVQYTVPVTFKLEESSQQKQINFQSQNGNTIRPQTTTSSTGPVDIKTIERRLHEILTAVIKENKSNWLLYFSEKYQTDYKKACKKADLEGGEYPRIWWAESDDDPNQFSIKSVKVLSGDIAYSDLALIGDLYTGTFEVILKKENGNWVIDKVTQKGFEYLNL